jgi:hypothetical protein
MGRKFATAVAAALLLLVFEGLVFGCRLRPTRSPARPQPRSSLALLGAALIGFGAVGVARGSRVENLRAVLPPDYFLASCNSCHWSWTAGIVWKAWL